MLSNYDAPAVADVMGIAFREDAERDAATASKAARVRRAAGDAHSTAFVLHVDPGAVRTAAQAWIEEGRSALLMVRRLLRVGWTQRCCEPGASGRGADFSGAGDAGRA